MNPLRTLLTTGLATLLVVGLGACGQDDPTDETTSAQPSPSTSLEDTVTTVFDRYWKQANTANPAEPPSAELKALLTDEAYADATKSAKTFPEITVKGKDEIVASKATAASDTEASVEVCYEVHRRLVVKKTYRAQGGTVAAGTDIRTDQNGRPIEDGAEMVNLVTFERESASDSWQVSSNQVGYKSSCDLEKAAR